MDRHPSQVPGPGSQVVIGLALVAGLALRVVGTAELHLWGDAAYSVYAAHRDLLAVATDRLGDGHPPLSYYLLKAWMVLAGSDEFVVRFSSAIPGLLTIALAYRLGRATLGTPAAVLGAWLVALNPYLVYYSRMPRMYEWLACFGVLALVLGIRLARRPSLGRGAAYALAVLAGAYTHYFGVLVPVALGPALAMLTGWRLRPLAWWFGGSAVAGLLTLPWVLFAFTASRETVNDIISNAPWPPDVAGLLEQFWLVAWSGELVPLDRARWLVSGGTAAAVASGLVAFAGWRRVRPHPPTPSPAGEEVREGVTDHAPSDGAGAGAQFFAPVAGGGRVAAALLLLVAIPVLLCLPVFQQYPYFVRPRFLIFLVPPLGVLLGGLLAMTWRVWRPLGACGAAVVLLATAGALRETYRLEAHIVEAESISVMQHLAEHARPTDGAVFHAFWQQGYVAAHLRERAPVMYPLWETPIERLPALLRQHGRLWLIMYAVERRHPKYPAEEWLDRNAYRANAQWFGTARVLLYTLPEERPEPVNANFGGEIALREAWVTARTVQPGDLLGVGLRWQALTRPAANYTAFVHLLDARGRDRTGEDAEPLWGLTRTADWTPGTEVVQRQGIPVWPDTPPGDYLVEAGLYRQDDGRRLPVLGGPPADRVLLGTVRVEPPRQPVSPARPSSAVVAAGGGRLAVAGFTAPEDRWHPGETQTIATATGPLTLTYRADPYAAAATARLTVVWQVLALPVQPVYSHVRLAPEAGGPPVAAAPAVPRLRLPADEWPADTPLPEEFRAPLPPDAPRGRYRLEVGFAPAGAAPVEWTFVGAVNAGR